jgi:hypothetical protein
MRCRSVAVPRAKASKTKATKPKPAPGPPVDLPASADEQTLVDRYYAMAEELNGRGSMELAVPFYRQTIALLLAEREQLRSLAGLDPATLPASADVDGVMAVAAALDHVLPLDHPFPEVELLRQLRALEEELSTQNRHEVAAALCVLEEQWGQPHPQLFALTAKLSLLEGELEQARSCFEQALSLEQGCVRLRLNTGAARLATGDVIAALEVLRPLTSELEALESLGGSSSFWNNLIRAELAADQPERAATALEQWLAYAPHTLDLEPWLEQAEALQKTGKGQSALSLLRAIAEHGTPEQRRAVLPELANVFEGAGDFREAALLYRELLRPSLG